MSRTSDTVEYLMRLVFEKEQLAYITAQQSFVAKLTLQYPDHSLVRICASGLKKPQQWPLRKLKNRQANKVLALHPDFHGEIFNEAAEMAFWTERLEKKYSDLRTFFGFLVSYPDDNIPTIALLPLKLQAAIVSGPLMETIGYSLPPGHQECIDIIHQQIGLDLLGAW